MFDTLTAKLDATFKKLRSRGKLHPKQVDNALGEIRTALLEADVAVEVADQLLDRVRTRALSEEVMKSLTPAQQVIKVVRDELQTTLGGERVAFVLPSARTAVVMMAGVQGSGKTTAAAKLALRLKKAGRRPLLVGADLERPAAVEQLFTLGREVDVPVVSDGRDPVKVAKAALKDAERRGADVVIVDTGGRLHVDAEMMKQARRIRDAVKPDHVLMASDAMTGQDAVVQAREFQREVETTGFVLTKLDGDARGGAALSITAVTGRPVFFAGVGEKLEDLEEFHPDRMASRIMGMGDVLGLIDKASEQLDADEAKASAEKMLQGSFTLEDFLAQLRQMRQLGPIQDLLKMLPGVPGGRNAIKEIADQVDEGKLRLAEAVILSMTPEERREPGIISGSRRLRIARGSGTTTSDVNTLLKDFEGARKMMRTMMGGGKGIPGMLKLPKMPKIWGERNAMTTRIRLRRMGSNKRPFFRVVVADQRSPRDGRFIENIGKYHPLEDPSVIDIDQDRALHWLRVGAQPSNQVRNLMQKTGIWDEFVRERPSAAVAPAKEREQKERISKKAKEKAEAAAEGSPEVADEASAAAAEPMPEPEAEVSEATAAEAAEAAEAEQPAAEAEPPADAEPPAEEPSEPEAG